MNVALNRTTGGPARYLDHRGRDPYSWYVASHRPATPSIRTDCSPLHTGLSWLIGSSLAEVLTSIIFLFVKHPYDVGDRVQIDKEQYTVKEIRLRSTILLDSRSCYVQAPNTVLSTKVRCLFGIRAVPSYRLEKTRD